MAFKQVRIHHGLCTSFHSMEHKPQLVVGIQDRLHKLGYRADLNEVPYVNYCMVEMCGHEVFRCNLLNLRFSTHYARDVVAQRAISAVQVATERLIIARNHLWFRNLISEDIHRRGPYDPKDYWPVEMEIKPYAKCNKCVACCDILVSKKSIREQTASKCYEFNICSQPDIRQSMSYK